MKRAERQPTGDLTIYAGIYLKTWNVPDADTLIPQHAHEHPHITYLVRGTIIAWAGDEMLGMFTAPAAVKIAANIPHRFRTMCNDVVFACIHSIGEADDVAIAAEHALELED